MITPDWYTYELNLLRTHKELQEQILRDIARRIIKTDMNITETAVWQVEMAQKSGMLYDDIIKEIAKRTKSTTAEIRQIFKDAKVEVFNYDDEMLIENGENPETVKYISPKMQNTMKSALAKTSTEAKNLTKTTAVTSQTSYLQACDIAHQKVVSGAFSYGEAIKSAIKFAANQGVKVIYPSGHISSLDVAIRRSVLTGVNQTAGQLQKMRADELECDIMEISAHSGARPSHAVWQGQLVSRSGKQGYLSLDDIGYGEVTGFMGANCRHNWYMYFGGMRMYTPDEIYAMNNATVKYDDIEYTEYEATQIQRKFERNIRQYKNELVMYDEAMKNTDGDTSEIKTEFNFTAQKLKQKEAELADFCEQTGLRRDRYREQVFAVQTEKNIASFGRSVSGKAIWANKKALTKQQENDIIKEIKDCGIKCEQLSLKPKQIDTSKLTLDEEHINKERKRNITKEQAIDFVKNAKFSATGWHGKREKYYGLEGVAYIDVVENVIKTAYTKDNFDDIVKRALEVYKKYEK